jgi:hypothetical protein
MARRVHRLRRGWAIVEELRKIGEEYLNSPRDAAPGELLTDINLPLA